MKEDNIPDDTHYKEKRRNTFNLFNLDEGTINMDLFNLSLLENDDALNKKENDMVSKSNIPSSFSSPPKETNNKNDIDKEQSDKHNNVQEFQNLNMNNEKSKDLYFNKNDIDNNDNKDKIINETSSGTFMQNLKETFYEKTKAMFSNLLSDTKISKDDELNNEVDQNCVKTSSGILNKEENNKKEDDEKHFDDNTNEQKKNVDNGKYNEMTAEPGRKKRKKDVLERKKKNLNKEIIKSEKRIRKYRTKKMLLKEAMEKGISNNIVESNITANNNNDNNKNNDNDNNNNNNDNIINNNNNNGDMFSNSYDNSYIKENKYNKKLCFPQNNLLSDFRSEPIIIQQDKRKIIKINTINKIKRKYKKFRFCINKVFKKKSINDIIALNENIHKNKDLLTLFKKKDLANLKKKNLSFFMDTLKLEKIDMLIMKRIQMCLEKIKNTLLLTCTINNVQEIVNILKKAFEKRLYLMWPLIEFSNKYRLDQYFHLLGKNKNHINSSFKDTKLFVHQNISSLILYFNQRSMDDKWVEYLKSQMKPKRRRRKTKMKEQFLEDKPIDYLNTMNSQHSNNFIGENFSEIETVESKANEYAFVGYNQKRLLTQITPYDYRVVLNSNFCNKFFTPNWREQQSIFIDNLHFDMVPDTDEIKKHFENVYIRYMEYDEEKLRSKSDTKSKEHKKKDKKYKMLFKKKEGKGKPGRKKKIKLEIENVSNEIKIKKPRKKYERVKPRKSKNAMMNEEKSGNSEKQINNVLNVTNIENKHKSKKGRKPKESNLNNLNINEDINVAKASPDTLHRASLEFMNPNLFT
ncbi:hypothetical protein C923_04989 [Plasmodium falciparum UGT5.1]|uniref:Uncharacterized protein n=1 Tax=Plasmodium falciparum UGT5.1 TaxID=1237627 RepID=W7JRX8_PLAFA|nr:hypothetical protein C923_04993 [Plasmodium falciparum UGT5.1]EWC74331.1 hypothetical protein C923_04989 [Plasmodium falciparum UGT5.1]